MSSAVKIVMVEDDHGHARLIEKNIRRANISNEIVHFDAGGAAIDYLFSDEVRANGARVLALSTMMTTTLPNMRRTVELARALEPCPVIVVGGAPLSSALAADMGADGYGENAAKAPKLIQTLLS